MRISSIPNDEGYHPMVHKEDFFQIYLDNVNVSKTYLICVADEQEGFIEHYMTNDNGSVKVENDIPITNRLFGNIVIKFKK